MDVPCDIYAVVRHPKTLKECAHIEYMHTYGYTPCVSLTTLIINTYIQIYMWDLATLLWLSISLSALFYDKFAAEYKMPSKKKKEKAWERGLIAL